MNAPPAYPCGSGYTVGQILTAMGQPALRGAGSPTAQPMAAATMARASSWIAARWSGPRKDSA
jgi:hypothetical protein